MRFLFAAREEGGIALITALLTLLVLSSLTASFVLVSQTEIWGTSNYKTVTQSRYLAEAGAERTLEWFRRSYTAPSATYGNATDGSMTFNGNAVQLSAMNGYTSNFPSSTMTDSFSSTLGNQAVSATGISGTWSSRAILLDTRTTTSFAGTPGSSQMWKIISQGNIAGVRNAVVEVQEVVERRGVPVFNYGVFATGTGCKVINVSGAGYTDSWDSSQGTYTNTHQNSGGDMGSNGNLEISGSASVNGSFSTPLTLSTPSTNCSNPGNLDQVYDHSSGSVVAGVTVLGAPLTFENPVAITPAPPTTAQNINNSCGSISGCSGTSPTFYLTPGNYGNLTISGNGVKVVFSAGTYNINSFVGSGGGSVAVDVGAVKINVAGASLSGGAGAVAIDVSGGGVLNNTGLPSNLAWIYGGTAGVKLSGGSAAYEVVYAPNAAVTVSSGTGAFWVAIVGKTVDDSGGYAIHYDTALRNNFSLNFNWKTISISRSKS